MKNRLISILSLFLFLSVLTPDLPAQCPMCKIGAESNLRNGGTAGNGLNIGILYLFVMPYLLVGGIGYVWWKNRKKEDEIEF
ncbi:MAG: hypothetical protein H6577_00075 [Lewinellaceae bacterium]|nr:hypothetical protein [Saprospiraceae bacterium]MCB9336507.1 hypothetical protein [Lewinellaceae bacterium]